MASTFPVYDICGIDSTARRGLMIERFGYYLEKHYQHLHFPHRHSFYHLVLFTKGKGSHTIDFEKYPVRAMQLYFMIPGQVHSWNFEEGVDGYIVHFDAELFTTFLQNGQYLERFPFFSGDSQDGVCSLSAEVYNTVLPIFESMIRESGENGALNLDMIRLRLLELFITVERFCVRKRSLHVPPQKQLLLKNFSQLIDKQFRNIKLPREYAELLYVTPNYLNALCQDLLGKTAGDLIRDRIILEAKRLLTSADLTITGIAYDLNFQDNSYFTRFFRKHTGMTPEEFRKNVNA